MQARTLYDKLSVTFLFVFPNKIIIIVVACESFESKAAILAAIYKQARKVQVQSVSFPLSVLLHSLSAKTFLAWIIPLAMQANNVLNPQIC